MVESEELVVKEVSIALINQQITIRSTNDKLSDIGNMALDLLKRAKEIDNNSV